MVVASTVCVATPPSRATTKTTAVDCVVYKFDCCHPPPTCETKRRRQEIFQPATGIEHLVGTSRGNNVMLHEGQHKDFVYTDTLYRIMRFSSTSSSLSFQKLTWPTLIQNTNYPPPPTLHVIAFFVSANRHERATQMRSIWQWCVQRWWLGGS